MSQDQEFESVRQNGPTWEPKQTGNQKDKNLKALEATDKSFIIGYYLGAKHEQGPDKNSTVHKIKMTRVGDPAHIIGDTTETDEVSIWGTNVLNGQLESVSPGQLIKITWEGKKEPKKGTKPYHSWDVGINKNSEPLKVGVTASIPESVKPAAEPQGAAPSIDKGSDDDDDQLPF